MVRSVDGAGNVNPNPTLVAILHAIVAVAVVGAGAALAVTKVLNGTEVFGMLSAVLAWAINSSGVNTGAQAAALPTIQPPKLPPTS